MTQNTQEKRTGRSSARSLETTTTTTKHTIEIVSEHHCRLPWLMFCPYFIVGDDKDDDGDDDSDGPSPGTASLFEFLRCFFKCSFCPSRMTFKLLFGMKSLSSSSYLSMTLFH